MPFCTKCGQQISDTSKFCTKCGHPLIKPAQQNPGPVLIEQKEEHGGMQGDEINKDLYAETPTTEIIDRSSNQPTSLTRKGNFFATNKKNIIIFTSLISAIGILVLAYYIFIRKGEYTTNEKYLSKSDTPKIPPILINSSSPLQNEPGSGDSVSFSLQKEQLPTNASNDPKQPISDNQPINSTNGSENPDLKPLNPNSKETIEISNDGKDPDDFTFLTVSQIKKDLFNKSLCEGLTYTGEDQKLIIVGGVPDNIYQKKLDLFGGVTVRIQFIDDTESKSCSVEVFYKKGNNKFNFITYVQK